MKKLLALILAALMLASMVPAMAATEYDVTEPITITWWHAHESSFQPDLDYIVNKFNAENGMGITVVPQYIGSYTEITLQAFADCDINELENDIRSTGTAAYFNHNARSHTKHNA